MKSLIEAQPNRIYQVHSVTASDDTKRHLQTLGVTPGNRIALLQLQKENGIVLLQKSRVALDKSILENITIEEVKEKGEWRSEEHTSELQSRFDLVCRLLLEQ